MAGPKRLRNIIFLRDVLWLALTAFGGPQAHIALFFERLVHKRGYLTESELIELNALCQILPGPTSTQTITAIGFRRGGPNLAYLTLLIWMLPAVSIMILAALVLSMLPAEQLRFARYIQPVAIGFVAFAGYRISVKVVTTKTGFILMTLSAVVCYLLRSPFIFPLILISSGMLTAFKFQKQPKEDKERITIQWSNFILWASFFIGIAVLGALTRERPILLLENFYRNGSLIFGGGQVLIPLLYTEFVEFKAYLSSSEFLTGLAIGQSLPGPVFSFSAYIGTLSMRGEGTFMQLLGGLFSAIGIFLPGTFLIFFVIRFWDQLKRFRVVRASLEGINAASAGMVIAAAVILFEPLDPSYLNIGIVISTFGLLLSRKVPAPFIIITAAAAGFIW